MKVLIIGEARQYVKGIVELNEKEGFPHHITILASDNKHKREEFSSFSERGLTYEFDSYRSTKILLERSSEFDIIIYTANPKNREDYYNRGILERILPIIKNQNKERREKKNKPPITTICVSSWSVRDVVAKTIEEEWLVTNGYFYSEQTVKEEYSKYYSNEEIGEMLLDWEDRFLAQEATSLDKQALHKLICKAIKGETSIIEVIEGICESLVKGNIKDYSDMIYELIKIYRWELICKDFCSPTTVFQREKLLSQKSFPERPNDQKDYVIVRLPIIDDLASMTTKKAISNEQVSEVLFRLMPIADGLKGKTIRMAGGLNHFTTLDDFSKMEEIVNEEKNAEAIDNSPEKLPEGKISVCSPSLPNLMKLWLQRISKPWNHRDRDKQKKLGTQNQQ